MWPQKKLKPRRGRALGLIAAGFFILNIFLSSCGLDVYSSYIFPIDDNNISTSIKSFLHIFPDQPGYEEVFRGYRLYYKLSLSDLSEDTTYKDRIKPANEAFTRTNYFFNFFTVDRTDFAFSIDKTVLINPSLSREIHFDNISIQIGGSGELIVQIKDKDTASTINETKLFRYIKDPGSPSGDVYKLAGFNIFTIGSDNDLPSDISNTANIRDIYLSIYAVPYGFDASNLTYLYADTPSYIGGFLLTHDLNCIITNP